MSQITGLSIELDPTGWRRLTQHLSLNRFFYVGIYKTENSLTNSFFCHSHGFCF